MKFNPIESWRNRQQEKADQERLAALKADEMKLEKSTRILEQDLTGPYRANSQPIGEELSPGERYQRDMARLEEIRKEIEAMAGKSDDQAKAA